jgi:hypothetical protein
MNSYITFTDKELFLLATTQLEMDSTPAYSIDFKNTTIYVDRDEACLIVDILHSNGIFNFSTSTDSDNENDQFRTDAEADSDALRSAGYDDEENYCSSVDSFNED